MGLVPAAIAGSFRQTSSSGADAARHLVAEREHLAELEAGIDVEQREGNRAGVKRLLRQAQHDGRIFADGVEHHGPLKLGGHFANDVNALGLEETKMAQARVVDVRRAPGGDLGVGQRFLLFGDRHADLLAVEILKPDNRKKGRLTRQISYGCVFRIECVGIERLGCTPVEVVRRATTEAALGSADHLCG